MHILNIMNPFQSLPWLGTATLPLKSKTIADLELCSLRHELGSTPRLVYTTGNLSFSFPRKQFHPFEWAEAKRFITYATVKFGPHSRGLFDPSTPERRHCRESESVA